MTKKLILFCLVAFIWTSWSSRADEAENTKKGPPKAIVVKVKNGVHEVYQVDVKKSVKSDREALEVIQKQLGKKVSLGTFQEKELKKDKANKVIEGKEKRPVSELDDETSIEGYYMYRYYPYPYSYYRNNWFYGYHYYPRYWQSSYYTYWSPYYYNYYNYMPTYRYNYNNCWYYYYWY